MNKKVKIILGVILAIALIIGAVSIVIFRGNKGKAEKEIVEIISELNNGSGYHGDWNNSLYITRVNRVKKIDVKLYNKEQGDYILKEDSICYIMNINEKQYGNVEICVVNGEVTANSILGETIDELWESNFFTKDNIDLDKINSLIK